MKTGTGIEIAEKDLTHEFKWKEKVVPVGKFDPSEYPTMSKQKSIDALSQHIFDQLEDSRMFTNDEMSEIGMAPQKQFLEAITKRKKQ